MRGDPMEMAILLDAYGALLTEKQREYCDWYYNEDLSLTEIAENAGITAPGAHDIISRASERLRETERRLGFVRRVSEARAGLSRAAAFAEARGEKRLMDIINEVANGL